MTLEARIMARAKGMPIEHEVEWSVSWDSWDNKIETSTRCACGYQIRKDFEQNEWSLARNWAKAAAEIHKEDNA